MLVVARKAGEAVVIGEGPETITIWIGPHRGAQTKVGIEAPREVRVVRGELIGVYRRDLGGDR